MDNNLNKPPLSGVTQPNNLNPTNTQNQTTSIVDLPPLPKPNPDQQVPTPMSQPSVVGVVPQSGIEGQTGYITEDKPKKLNLKVVILVVLSLIILSVVGYFAFNFLARSN